MSVSQHLGPGFSTCSPWTAQKHKFSDHNPESETWWMGTSNLYFNNPWGDSDTLKFENLCSRRDARLGRVQLPLSTVTVPWLHFICMYYLQGVGSPRLPLHVPISSITHNQVGPGTRITHHQNLQSRVVWRNWNAEGWELSFPCIWVTLDNFCLFLNYILFFSITLEPPSPLQLSFSPGSPLLCHSHHLLL